MFPAGSRLRRAREGAVFFTGFLRAARLIRMAR